MLVAVLTSSTSARVPFNLEVASIELYDICFSALYYRDRYRRRVNSTFTFGGWDALDAVSAGLVVEL